MGMMSLTSVVGLRVEFVPGIERGRDRSLANPPLRYIRNRHLGKNCPTVNPKPRRSRPQEFQ